MFNIKSFECSLISQEPMTW